MNINSKLMNNHRQLLAVFIVAAMRTFPVFAILLYTGVSICRPANPVSTEGGLILPDTAELGLGCSTTNGTLLLDVNTATNTTTALCTANDRRSWDDWRKFFLLSGYKRNFYEMAAHPVVPGITYEYRLETNRKIESVDLFIQASDFAIHPVITGILVHHTKLGPMTFRVERQGFLYMKLYFRKSILPIYGKTRTTQWIRPRPPPT